MSRKQVVHRLLEFFIVGVIMGISEDLLAIILATDAKITPHIFIVATIVAMPFAIISELLVDLKFFRKMLFKKRK